MSDPYRKKLIEVFLPHEPIPSGSRATPGSGATVPISADTNDSSDSARYLEVAGELVDCVQQ